MADKKITELTQLVEASVNALDVLPIADISATETRKITTKALAEAGARLMADGTIPFAKVDTSDGTLDGSSLQPGSIGSDQIAAGAVGTDELADDAVTTSKIAAGAVVTSSVAPGLDATVLADGSVRGQKLADQTITNDKIQDATITGGKIAPATIDGSNVKLNTLNADHIDANSIGASELSDGAVDTAALQDQAVTGPKLNASAFNRGLDQDVDGIVGITNEIEPGTHAGITYTEQGLISGITTPVPAADLPKATATDIGVVSIPAGGGLSVAGTGAVTINNTVVAGTGPKVSYTDKGLVTGSQNLDPGDLPIATNATLGGVIVPDTDPDGSSSPINVDGNGTVRHASSGVTPGSYAKFTVNKYGLVVSGSDLQSSDLPEIDAGLITTGDLNGSLLVEESVDSPAFADYATCLMQEDNPGQGDFLGQMWYTPSTAQLRVFSRGSGPQNMWLPVGFGALQANNLRWGGTFDASTDKVVSCTAIGTSEGLLPNTAFPAPTDMMSGLYLLCQIGGSNMTQNNISGTTFDPGDWALCLDGTQGWIHIDSSATGGGGGGGATYLTDLADVVIGGMGGPFETAPRMSLTDKQILKYDGGTGMWKNTDLIDGGTF